MLVYLDYTINYNFKGQFVKVFKSGFKNHSKFKSYSNDEIIGVLENVLKKDYYLEIIQDLNDMMGFGIGYITKTVTEFPSLESNYYLLEKHIGSYYLDKFCISDDFQNFGVGKIIAKKLTLKFDKVIFRSRNPLVVKCFSKFGKLEELFTEENLSWYLVDRK